MAIRPFNWFIKLANSIIGETVDSANSKERIGGGFRDMAKSAIMTYDPDADGYDSGQVVYLNGNLYAANQSVGKGQSPTSATASSRAKWNPAYVDTLTGLSTNSKLPVTSNALKQVYEALKDSKFENIVGSSELEAGLAQAATGQEVEQGISRNKFVSPFWFAKVIDLLTKKLGQPTWQDTLLVEDGANVTDQEVMVKTLRTQVQPGEKTATSLAVWVYEFDKAGKQTGRRLTEVSFEIAASLIGTAPPPITPPDGKTIIALNGIDGPTSIDEGILTSQYLASVTYNDGSTGKLVPTTANGFVRSIIGQGETISDTGVVPIYSNQVVGDAREFEVRIGYRLPNKTEDTVVTLRVKINDKSVSQDIVMGDLLIPHYVDSSLGDPFGLIDGADCAGGFRCWAANFSNPEVPVKLDILRDNIKVDEVTVNRTRSDVSDFYGLTNNAGHVYGLVWSIPDNLKDSQTHRYTARFTGTTILLDGDPISLTCAPPDNAACPNLALLTTGGTVSASSSVEFGATGKNSAFNGDKSGANSSGAGWWESVGENQFPQNLSRDFGANKTIAEIEIVGLRDDFGNTEPIADSLVTTKYGLLDFDVQYFDGGTWKTLPGGSIRNNNKVLRRVRLSTPVTTSQIRVLVIKSIDAFARIVELVARECLTGPADQPTTIRINGAPSAIDEGSSVNLTGEIVYADGRVDAATLNNSTYMLAADTGDYDTATGTHAAASSDCLLGNNGRFTANNNATRNDTRNVRVKLSAYGLSDTKTISVIDKTPNTEYIVGIQTKRRPNDDSIRGLYLRVKTVGGFVPSFAWRRDDYPTAAEMKKIMGANTGEYQYIIVIQDGQALTGPAYITLGFNQQGNLIKIKVPDMSVTDNDWITQL